MTQKIGFVTLLVHDYDEAIRYYTQILGFDLISDTALNEDEKGKRWVLIAPPGSSETRLLLMCAKSPEQKARVGDQTGARVFLFLHTDNFQRDFELFRQRGVKFTEEPRHETYGTVAVFEDFLGNMWDLLELKPEYRR